MVNPSGPSRSDRLYFRAICCAWAIVLLVICVRVGISPHRQSVYSVDYVTAGAHWFHGQEVYTASRHFVYSPLAAAAFTPFSAFPLRVSNILWRLFCAVALLSAAVAWMRSGLARLGDGHAPVSLLRSVTTGLLLLLPLAVGNLNLGQLNVLVLAVTAAGVLAVHGRHWNVAALLLAGTAFMKIYPVAVGLLLALLFPRQLSWRLGLALVGLFLFSLVIQRPAYAWGEYRHWAATLHADDRLDIDLYSSWRDFGFLLRACGLPLPDQAYRLMEVASGGALALFLLVGKWRGGWSETRLLGGAFALGCTWMVLFGPATEAATYVIVSLPVCAALIAAWTRPSDGEGRRVGGLALVFGASYFLLVLSDATNSWMHGGTHHLYMRALQPVAALIFSAGIICWLLQRPRAVESPLDNLNSPLESSSMNPDWLTNRISIDQLHGDTNERDFWKDILDEYRDGDELWEFSSPRESWENLAGRAGVALVRDGKIVTSVVRIMN